MRNKIQDVMRRRAAGEKGFTLVELLVVVIILVVLAAVAVPIFLNQKTKADESAAQSTAAQAAQVLQAQRSVGGTASGTPSATSVTFTSGTGDVTATATGIYRTGTTAYTAGQAVGDTWCVQGTSGSSTYRMTATMTAPTSGACS